MMDRITRHTIHENIFATRYVRDGLTTICIIELRNGFKFIGHETPVSEDNFVSELGEQYAFEDAFRQIWSHMGFLLRDRIARGEA